tara:strand:- start:140 stop:631 length:492 start_codon:yes stop_codon:yes gene_type:complete
MKIIDNALNHEDFTRVKEYMMSKWIDWYFSETIVTGEEENFPISCFTHAFYDFRNNRIHCSSSYDILLPIIEILKPASLVRVKANLYVNQNKFVMHDMHTDNDRDINAALFYVNSNNGKTIFLDGTEIESVENRLVIFKANTPHRSTNCTDQYRRVNINFNYI